MLFHGIGLELCGKRDRRAFLMIRRDYVGIWRTRQSPFLPKAGGGASEGFFAGFVSRRFFLYEQCAATREAGGPAQP